MDIPTRYEIIGNCLAVKWSDEREDFWDASFLRKHSPSAEQAGEMDIFGRIHGAANPENDFHEIRLKNCHPVGNYGLRLVFSDGHATGIYSWNYLQGLSEIAEGG